ncbi:MAG: hypothetical protein KAI66_14335 [Lentisphaeria bacterium]|nr:hypothetical protein [Lentisphaeria bacterium]
MRTDFRRKIGFSELSVSSNNRENDDGCLIFNNSQKPYLIAAIVTSCIAIPCFLCLFMSLSTGTKILCVCIFLFFAFLAISSILRYLRSEMIEIRGGSIRLEVHSPWSCKNVGGNILEILLQINETTMRDMHTGSSHINMEYSVGIKSDCEEFEFITIGVENSDKPEEAEALSIKLSELTCAPIKKVMLDYL